MRFSRFSVNLAVNVLNFVVTVLVGVWLTPYLIHHLGVAAYGLIPLATAVTSYLSLFTLALNSAVGRFMTMALDRQDDGEANRIFNTSFWGSTVILLLLLAPCIWFSFHASWFFQIPADSGRDVAWLFLSIVGTFYLTTLSSAFSVTAFCRNRFDLTNAVNMVNTAVRVVVVVLLFSVCVPRVWHMGAALFCAALASCAGAVLIWRYLTPMLELRLAWFSLRALRQMTGMGGWIVIDQIGAIFFLNIDLIVVNKVVGVEAAGRYGAIMMWTLLLRGLAAVVAGVFIPTIIMLYARDDMSGLVRYTRRAVKFCGLVMALPIGLICGFSVPLLRLWLGSEYVPLAPLMSLMTIHQCLNLAVLPLFSIQVATNHVRVPAVVTCVTGAMNLGLAWWLSGPAGWGMYGVAMAGAIVYTARNMGFVQLYAAHLLGVKWTTFYRGIVPTASVAMGLSGVAWLIAGGCHVQTWPSLVLAGAVLSCLYLATACGFLLSGKERDYALQRLGLRKVLRTSS